MTDACPHLWTGRLQKSELDLLFLILFSISSNAYQQCILNLNLNLIVITVFTLRTFPKMKKPDDLLAEEELQRYFLFLTLSDKTAWLLKLPLSKLKYRSML